MNKSPAALVKEHFGDKAKLVAALGPLTNDDLWVPRVNETKGLAGNVLGKGQVVSARRNS